MTKHTSYYKKQRIKAKKEKLALILCCALLIGLVMAGVIKMWEWNHRSADLVDMQQAALHPNAPAITGKFALQDYQGKAVHDTDFKGKFRIVYFGYTYCPDMCPTGLSAIGHALDQLGEKAKDVAALFITIDPKRDQPQKLHDYVTGFHPAIISLTGNEAETDAAAKAFQVYYKRVSSDHEDEGENETAAQKTTTPISGATPNSPKPVIKNAENDQGKDSKGADNQVTGNKLSASSEEDMDYEIDHSTLIYLLDRDGKLIRTFPDETAPSELVKAINEGK